MRQVMHFSARQIRPAMAEVLRRQWMPAAAVLSPRLHALFAEAAAAFDELARPVAVMEDVSPTEFDDVFSGAAEPETPVGHIFPRATALALFAATVGGELEMAVRQRFRAHDAPTGFALDAFASAAAERLAAIVADRYRSIVYEKRVRLGRVLPYSPGYCGWDVKGQAQLFARLRPEDIGIRLNRQCVMQPTKSVSGVLIAGARDVHVFDPGFLFCRACSARACIHRMADVHDLESQI